MFRNLDPVLDTVTVLTPQLIDEGRVGIEPGAPRGRPLVSVEVLVRRHYLRSDFTQPPNVLPRHGRPRLADDTTPPGRPKQRRLWTDLRTLRAEHSLDVLLQILRDRRGQGNVARLATLHADPAQPQG